MLMVFKLITAAAKTLRRLQGENLLPKVIRGVTFRGGIEVSPLSNYSRISHLVDLGKVKC